MVGVVARLWDIWTKVCIVTNLMRVKGLRGQWRLLCASIKG